MAKAGLRGGPLYDARASRTTASGTTGRNRAGRAGRSEVKTMENRQVKPDVENLRTAVTTWEGLHGSPGVHTGRS